MTTEAPTISVLVTTYNRCHSLPRAIKSILKQDFTDFEIVIIDDDSTDKTERVVQSFKDDRIRYFKNTENVGSKLGDREHVRRFVYELMRGQYFIYVCDDDYLLPSDLFSHHMEQFSLHDNLSMSIAGQLSVFVRGEASPPEVNAENILDFLQGNDDSFVEKTDYSDVDCEINYIRGAFPKRFMESTDFLRLFSTEPTSRNIIVGGTIFSRKHFMQAEAISDKEGSKWQAGYEFFMGPAWFGDVSFLDTAAIVTEIRPENASFQRTQREHYSDSIISAEKAFSTPLEKIKEEPLIGNVLQAKETTIKQLSRAFLNNSIAIKYQRNLTYCSDDNIAETVSPLQVTKIYKKNSLSLETRDYQLFVKWFLPKRAYDFLYKRVRRKIRKRRIERCERNTKMGKWGYQDKIVPVQEFFSYMYTKKGPFVLALHEMLTKYSSSFNPDQFTLEVSPNVGLEEMSSPPYFLSLINTLIALSGARNVLEIGTFVGHTTMQIAKMVPDDGHVTSIEVFDHFAEIARKNVKNNGLSDKVTIINQDADEAIESFSPGQFDMIFIDGNKEKYLDYVLKGKKVLSERGVIVVDDVFFHGDALNEPASTEKGKGCQDLLSYFEDRTDEFDRLLLPIGNGVLVLTKK